MTEGNPFTKDELNELLTAVEARRDQLAKLYAKAGRDVNKDWKMRDKALRELRGKIIGMLTS